MATINASIAAPVIEPLLMLDGHVHLRVARVPCDLIDDSAGGYLFLKALTRSGFGGVLGQDYELLDDEVTQSPSTPFRDVQLADTFTGRSFHFRCIAVNSLATIALQSPPSNVVSYYWDGANLKPVPAWPCDILPNRGLLKGVFTSFQDEDFGAGLTWHEVRTVMSAVSEQLWEELATSLNEGTIYDLYRNPPPSVRAWFEAAVAQQLVLRSSLPAEQITARATLFQAEAQRWWDELHDDDGVLILPGAGAAAVGGVRVVR